MWGQSQGWRGGWGYEENEEDGEVGSKTALNFRGFPKNRGLGGVVMGGGKAFAVRMQEML